MVRLFGYSRAELLSMSAADLKPPEDVPRMFADMVINASGRTRHIGVRRYLCKDRSSREVDITAHETMLDGELVVVAVCVDVTHSRRIEEQLRQSQKMDAVGQLAGGIAHDFNNILAAILANADLALEAVGFDHSVTPELREIETAAKRAASLTRQLLAFSRQEPRDVKVLALNSVVTNIEKMLVRIVGEDIQMSSILDPHLDSIEADVGQIEQILMNLVVNARDAMTTGGRLTIETSNVDLDQAHAHRLGVKAGRHVTLAVSDTGCGMDAATQTRIFEPFFTTKDVGKGTGLGLSTVFGIVRQGGGAVVVESEAGRGSTFRIYLPHVGGSESVAPAEQPPPMRIPAGSKTVLVVEDDEMLRGLICRRLSSWGYTLFAAPNAAAAIEVLRAQPKPIDLLLTDLVMPGIDGRALATRALAERPSIKVLFMSGYDQHVAIKTAALGTDDHFIEKPFSATVLSQAIQSALGATV